MTCNPGTIFSVSANKCVEGNQNTCEFGSETTTKEPESELLEVCRGVFFGARPYQLSSNVYVGCIRGEGTLKLCFPNEYFDANINECVDSVTVTVTESTTTTSTASTTTLFPVTPPPVIEGTCDGITQGYAPYPDDCSLYILCIDGSEANILQCPQDQIFDKDMQSCRPGNQITCVPLEQNTQPITEPTATEVITTEAITETMTETSTTIELETESPTPEVTTIETTSASLETTTAIEEPESNPCDGLRTGTLPHNDDCTKYIRCNNGK